MMSQDSVTIEAIAGIGISVTPHAQAERGWGWSIQNDKIIRDWEGPYPTPAAAVSAGLSWLVEHARKGLVCNHTHAVIVDDDPLAPWERFFEAWDGSIE